MPDKLDKIARLTQSLSFPEKGLIKLKNLTNVEDYDVLVQNKKENKTYKIDSSLFGSSSQGTILFPNGFEDVTESRDFQHSDVGKALRLANDDVFLTMPEGEFWTEDEKGKVIVVIANSENVGYDQKYNMPVLMKGKANDFVGEYALLITGETEGQSDVATISSAILKDGDDWKTAIRYLYDNLGDTLIVPTDEEVLFNFRYITESDFVDVGGGVFEYELQVTDASHCVIINVDKDLYPDDYRVVVPNDLCAAITPFPAMKCCFAVVDNGRIEHGSSGDFIRPLSYMDSMNNRGLGLSLGHSGEPIYMIFADGGGETIAFFKGFSMITESPNNLYTTAAWNFKDKLNSIPISEGGTYHLKTGYNVLYTNAPTDINSITVYLDANTNFHEQEILVFVSGANIASITWRDNDDDDTDITGTFLPDYMYNGSFCRILNGTFGNFYVLSNFNTGVAIPLIGTHTDHPVTGNIVLDNDVKVITGSVDSGIGRGTSTRGGDDGGVSQFCSIGYEKNWQAGSDYILDSNGLIRVAQYKMSPPTVNDDETKGYKVGSFYFTDDATKYECTDATTGAAVWI